MIKGTVRPVNQDRYHLGRLSSRAKSADGSTGSSTEFSYSTLGRSYCA